MNPDSLLKYLQFGNLFCGIEHTSLDGKDKLIATLLKKKKKELIIEEVFEAGSLEELIPKMPPKQPAFVIINNGQVLSKRIDNFQGNNSKAINQAFPNIDLNDFYYEILAQEGISFVALCRKKYVEELIERYKALKILILGFSLGNLIVSNLAPFSSLPELLSSNAKIRLENNKITAIEKIEPKNENYDINGLNVSSHALLSFSAALSLVVSDNERKTNFSKINKMLRDDYFHARFFDLFSKFSLIFILGLLLINFFYFNHYYAEVGRLQQNLQSDQSLKNKIEILDRDLLRSQKVVENILRGNSSKSSFYANAIAQSLPYAVILNDLDFQPLSKQIKEEDPIIIAPNIIMVSGQSSNNKVFSEWLLELGALEWVEKVEIISYADVSTSKSNFELAITIKK